MSDYKLKLRKRDITKQELIDDIKRVAAELDCETVKAAEYGDKGRFGVTTICRKFGTWNKALKAAGLGISARLNIPDDELFENLAEVWQSIGKQPVGKDIEKSNGTSKFSLGTYEKRFGSWNNALIAFSEFINNPDSETKINKISKKKKSNANTTRTPRKINWRIRATVLIRDNCICKMCGASPAKDPSIQLHIDHIQPWSKGGETVIENLQTLCQKCNIGKSDEIFE